MCFLELCPPVRVSACFYCRYGIRLDRAVVTY
nr:MAG TPA: hypothetical protein [Caudoviricetes sp.]